MKKFGEIPLKYVSGVMDEAGDFHSRPLNWIDSGRSTQIGGLRPESSVEVRDDGLNDPEWVASSEEVVVFPRPTSGEEWQNVAELVYDWWLDGVPQLRDTLIDLAGHVGPQVAERVFDALDADQGVKISVAAEVMLNKRRFSPAIVRRALSVIADNSAIEAIRGIARRSTSALSEDDWDFLAKRNFPFAERCAEYVRVPMHLVLRMTPSPKLARMYLVTEWLLAYGDRSALLQYTEGADALRQAEGKDGFAVLTVTTRDVSNPASYGVYTSSVLEGFEGGCAILETEEMEPYNYNGLSIYPSVHVVVAPFGATKGEFTLHFSLYRLNISRGEGKEIVEKYSWHLSDDMPGEGQAYYNTRLGKWVVVVRE